MAPESLFTLQRYAIPFQSQSGFVLICPDLSTFTLHVLHFIPYSPGFIIFGSENLAESSGLAIFAALKPNILDMKHFLLLIICLCLSLVAGTEALQAQTSSQSLNELWGKPFSHQQQSNQQRQQPQRQQSNRQQQQQNRQQQQQNNSSGTLSSISMLGNVFHDNKRNLKFIVVGEIYNQAGNTCTASFYLYDRNKKNIYAAPGTPSAYASTTNELSVSSDGFVPTGSRYSFRAEALMPNYEVIRALNGSNIAEIYVRCIVWCNGRQIADLMSNFYCSFRYNAQSCTRCNSSGVCVCYNCNGSGTSPTGQTQMVTIYNGLFATQVPQMVMGPCSFCSSTGRITCPDCEGHGTAYTVYANPVYPSVANTGGGGGGNGGVYNGGGGGGNSGFSSGNSNTDSRPQQCYSCRMNPGRCSMCRGTGYSVGTSDNKCHTCYGTGTCQGCRGTGHY